MAVPAGISVSDTIVNYSWAEAITVNTACTGISRAIYNGTAANNLTILMQNGDSIAFNAVPIGILPVRATKVTSAGTGTTLVALY